MTHVSAIIPTVGRPQLDRAIRSAHAQHGVDVEVVLVSDSISYPSCASNALGPHDKFVHTGGHKGASYARNLGVTAASGHWVAFLDDDDVWVPEKLQTQLRLASRLRDEAQSGVVIGSRHYHVARDGRRSRPMPTKLLEESQAVGDYLFVNRRPSGGRATIYTSTLLTTTEFASTVRWDESLRRHQDWDWLLRAEAAGAMIQQCNEPLTEIFTGSDGSISASTDWRASLAWADDRLMDYTADAYVDFLVGQVLRYALGARSRRGVAEVVKRVRRSGTTPHINTMLVGLTGLVPRKLVESAMVRIR